jgi:hypothetical protein
MTTRAARLGRALGVELARVAGWPVRQRVATPPPPESGPHPSHGLPGTASWAAAQLGLTEAQSKNRLFVQAAWKARLACCHPDAGGSDEAARDANLARDILLARLDA